MNAFLVLVVVTVCVGLVVLFSYQGLLAALRPVDAAWADLLAQLARRHEAARALAAAVDAHGDAERSAADAVRAACTTAAATDEVTARATAEAALSRHLDHLDGLIAQRADLRDDADLQRLRERPRLLEHDVHVARAVYDAWAQTYTTRCSFYPGRYVASWFAFPARPAFALPERRLLDPPPA